MDGSEQEKMELVVSLPASATYRQEDDFPPSLPCSRLAADSKDAGGSGQQLFLLEKKTPLLPKCWSFFFLTKPPSDFPRMADQHDECCMSGLCHMTHYFLHGVFEWETPIVKCHQSNKAGPHSTGR